MKPTNRLWLAMPPPADPRVRRECERLLREVLLAPDDVRGLEEMAARVSRGVVWWCDWLCDCWSVWKRVVLWLLDQRPTALLFRCQ